jgi:hypothetical protein
MSCSLLTGGLTIACSPNIGGIKKAYITDFSNVDGASDFTETSGTITAIAITSGENYYEFEFNKNSSFYTESQTTSLENGTQFVNQTVTLVIPRREVAKRNVIALLGQKPLSIIVLDQNDKYWLFGRKNGCNMMTNEGGSGTAKGDLNGYTLSFMGEEVELAPEVSSSAVTSVI